MVQRKREGPRPQKYQRLHRGREQIGLLRLGVGAETTVAVADDPQDSICKHTYVGTPHPADRAYMAGAPPLTPELHHAYDLLGADSV